MTHTVETFTPEEVQLLAPFFTNTDSNVFGIHNLPAVVKGALFARYSRSAKSLRRLFLDEFLKGGEIHLDATTHNTGEDRARGLFDRVFTQYGDDSVAQLGGAHIACENVSNVLTKVLEWGRLASYLEQSTRYIFYDRKTDDGYRYLVPPEILGSPVENLYRVYMDGLFDAYSQVVRTTFEHLKEASTKPEGVSKSVWAATLRAQACDTARGLLPASTQSNVGIFASGQAFEGMLLRMLAHPLAEARECAALMLKELRKMIPSFVKRVDIPDRGGVWVDYLRDTFEATRQVSLDIPEAGITADPPLVQLLEWDEYAEVKVAAAALYPHGGLSFPEMTKTVQNNPELIDKVFEAALGNRTNRRHKPGRGFEHTYYTFEVSCDYGAFRDLQRHRMLTLQWKDLHPYCGYETPDNLLESLQDVWHSTMKKVEETYEEISNAMPLGASFAAQYVIPFAYRIQFLMKANARSLMHMLELRTTPAGHPSYRRVCQEMHNLIRDKAGHHRIADAMSFVNHEGDDTGRLEAEKASEKKRKAQ